MKLLTKSIVTIGALAVGLIVPLLPASGEMKDFSCRPGGELSNERAQEVLSKVQQRYSGIDSLHGDFRQDSYVAALDEREASSGEMWFGKPGKMRWVYSKPRPQVVVINQSTLWLYQPENRQVVIDEIGNVLLSSLPVSFMMGLGNLSRDFDLTGACQGPDGVVLRLVPHKSTKKDGSEDALEGFDLLVDTTQFLPKGAKISSLGGNVTSIVFSNLSTKVPTADPRRFVLEYPKGVDVMDRRLSH
jgi:outer membrane lipoprotein carrier protein